MMRLLKRALHLLALSVQRSLFPTSKLTGLMPDAPREFDRPGRAPVAEVGPEFGHGYVLYRKG